MKLRHLTLVLVGAVSAARAEDSPLQINQRFQLRYNQWQSSQSPTVSTTQAVYEVETGMPVFTYRLGALALNGAVAYNRLAYGSEADSTSGLSRYGARVSLFPYRPFRLYLDYQHSQTPDLFGSGRVQGNTWGAGATFHSKVFQDVRLTYRHGDSKLADLRDNWSLWKLEANQRIGATQVSLQSTRQEYESPGSGPGWRLFIANLGTESHFGREWILRTRSQVQDAVASRWFNLSATIYGPISGAWHSLTTAATGATTAGPYRTSTAFASESLVYASKRWHAYGSGAYSQVETRALNLGNRTSSASLGSTYTLSQDWRIHGDLGVSGLSQTVPGQGIARTTTTMNLGIARGGDVPELIRHSLFFLSDWTFNRRVREEYPPNFVPSELAQEMFQRRMRQTGSFGFTADLWRISDNASQGKVDWARVTGQVQTRGAFTLYLAGDYKIDQGLSQPGRTTRNTNLLINSSYRVDRTSITATMGYSDSRQRLTPGLSTYGWMAPGLDGQSRNYSIGLTTRLWKVPLGALAQRFETSQAPGTTTLTTWGDLNFRQVSMRLRYEVTRMDNGFRSNRIVLDLLRWFDTIGLRSRP